NGGNPSNIGNEDGTSGAKITAANGQTYKYSPAAPYEDDHSATLADVAMHYWKTDLRDDLSNAVATSNADPAFWQHMVNFTVGLGVFGGIKPTKDGGLSAQNLAKFENGSLKWPDPTDNEDADRIDDLFHAAVNSRGQFFSAANPD